MYAHRIESFGNTTAFLTETSVTRLEHIEIIVGRIQLVEECQIGIVAIYGHTVIYHVLTDSRGQNGVCHAREPAIVKGFGQT